MKHKQAGFDKNPRQQQKGNQSAIAAVPGIERKHIEINAVLGSINNSESSKNYYIVC